MITFLLLNMLCGLGSWLHFIPYAPMFSSCPFGRGTIETTYLFGTMILLVIFFFLILSLVAYVFGRWRDREAEVRRMTAFLKKVFGRYVSSEVMDAVLQRPESLGLGGEKREVTMMMSDLRGFTQLSERLDPGDVMALLNRYFAVMMGILKRYHGTANDFFGDAMLVTFGAPQETQDHTQEAVACAVEMQNAMAPFNERNRREGLPELEMGIGLNTAEVVVGNIGTEERAKFGVVGSGVNLTARIESYAVGGQILISESVRQKAREVIRIDSRQDVLPKGWGTPLRIYELGGVAGYYNLSLAGKEHAMVTLERQIPLRCTVLEGKDVGKKEFEGVVIRLSKSSAEIALDGPVDGLINLKMNLGDVDESLSFRDFYGKVIKQSEGKKQIYLIHFTSIPPEVDAYFQSHRQHAGKPEKRRRVE